MKRLIALALLKFSSVIYAEQATLISIEPRMVTINKEVCNQQYSVEQRSSVLPIMGGVVGGLVGSQVGGTGRIAAILWGTVIGAGLTSAGTQAAAVPKTVCTYIPTQVQQGEIATFVLRGKVYTQILN
jgi:outer membrane lipoprotein SlyB